MLRRQGVLEEFRVLRRLLLPLSLSMLRNYLLL
jgi:hypothetical protein